MYKYEWDPETGGLLLVNEISKLSNEPRPVYYRELDTLGFNQYWKYPHSDEAPLMWAEANKYIYKGRLVAKTQGGSLYTAPEIILLEAPEPDGKELEFVDIPAMVEKNRFLMETLEQETIQKIYNVYAEYKKKIDVFYVAFSGGKDSVVALDLVQRALPHDEFLVLFGDTRMEFPDTYKVVEKISHKCKEQGIRFYRAQSKVSPEQTWKCFGPPSTSNRWCCSVHKTSPQINLLRKITEKADFTGMAFTGIRAQESAARSEYETVTLGQKHSGQYSCHTILEWNSAELYIYIYEQNLVLNEAYLRGNVRAGCLVCPNSSGKHDYIKRSSYKDQVDFYLHQIALTSGKTNYSETEMQQFIDMGYWRTRKSGRELNFGQDKFEVRYNDPIPKILIYQKNVNWTEWAKTIGDISKLDNNLYGILFENKVYEINEICQNDEIVLSLKNCGKTRNDIKFQSLLRSVIIKTLYCVACGVCEAECKFKCLHMKDGLKIGDNCRHCYKCHDVHGHCLRYNSIHNKISEGKKMASLDRYFSFGSRASWLDIFIKYGGKKEFWETDGDGDVANKKKDAFLNFLKDAELVQYNRNAEGDKYTRCIATETFQKISQYGAYDNITWAIIFCNLVYSPAFNWYVKNLEFDRDYISEELMLMLSEVLTNDISGHGKKNVLDALKIFLARTPLGQNNLFASVETEEKVSSAGTEKIILKSVRRCVWTMPSPLVILYSLYKFAENCGGRYQFTLSELMDDSIERDGVSPTQIFGLDRDTMVGILNGLTANYSEYINASFSLDLDNITLREEKTSKDILALF